MQIYTTSASYDYTAHGPVVIGLPQMKAGVKFSVEATSDIHISVSSSIPITTNSWEIVLGAHDGEVSFIRRNHQGEDLVTIHHMREDFFEVILV